MLEQYELVATSVTSALGIRLREIFPGVMWYRETIPAQMLVYPHWFVNQLTLNIQPERRNHWWLSYFATMRYHVAADPASVVGSLQQQLDDASIKLLADLDYIYWNGIPVRISNLRTEKIDGVLHCFCNVDVMATKPIEIDPLQEQLEVNIAQL